MLESPWQEQKLENIIFFVQHLMTVSYSYFGLIMRTLFTYTVWNIKMGPWQSPPRGGPGNRLNYIWTAKTVISYFFLCISLIEFCFSCRLWRSLLCWRFLESPVAYQHLYHAKQKIVGVHCATVLDIQYSKIISFVRVRKLYEKRRRFYKFWVCCQHEALHS